MRWSMIGDSHKTKQEVASQLPWKLLQLQLCLHLDFRASLPLTPSCMAYPQKLSISCPHFPNLFTQNLLFTPKIYNSIDLMLLQVLLSRTHLTNLLFFLKLMGIFCYQSFFLFSFFLMLYALSWSFMCCKDVILMFSE